MKAGFAERDITPALGMERPTGYNKYYTEVIHDHLKVRAAVFDDGNERVALVGIDAGGIQSVHTVHTVRSEVMKRCGIKEDHILLAASHTHDGGPCFGPLLPDEYDKASPFVKDLAAKFTIVPDPFYCELVIRQMISAICEADHNRKEVLLSAGSGHEDKVTFNRRMRMKNGRVYTHPGKGHPDILEPAGPIDPEVGVLAAWGPEGKLLGCVVNFACHGTTEPGGVSADWIYYLEKTIQGVYGNDAVVVFLNGAAGDVTQVNNRSLDALEFGERASRVVGQSVGAEVLKVLARAWPGELVPIGASSRTIRMKRRKPSGKHLQKSMDIVKRNPEGIPNDAPRFPKDAEWVFAKEIILLDYLVTREPEVNVEIQAIQIGPVVFIANPAEFFCQLGLEIKKESRFPFTYVVSLANGCFCYTPTQESFLPTSGGYETVLTVYSNLEISAGERIKNTSIELLETLKPGKIPESPKEKPATEAWGYGTLGPDLE